MVVEPLRLSELASHVYTFRLPLHLVNVYSPLQETRSVQNTDTDCPRKLLLNI